MYSSKDSPEEGIRHNSILYFSKKLKIKFNTLKKILYGSYVIMLIDIILIPILPSVFFNAYNIISLLVILFASLFCLVVFRHNFEIVTYEIYKSTVRVIYLLIAIIVVYYVDMFYTLLFKILLNFDNILNNDDSGFNGALFLIFGFFIYFLMNLSFPLIILFKLIQVKRGVLDLGQAKGESYDSIPTNENNEVKIETKIEMSNL